MVVRAHLLSHDAEIEEDLQQFGANLGRLKLQCGYLLVPHTLCRSDVPEVPQGSEYLRVVTEMWLERCLHFAKCIDPQANPPSTPFRQYPIPGTSATISWSCKSKYRRVQEHHHLLHRISRCRPAAFI